MLTPAALLADLLRSAAPAAQWSSGGMDRSFELAELLIANGISDVAKLSLQLVDVYEALSLRGVSFATREAFDSFNADVTTRTVRTREGGSVTITEPRNTWRSCVYGDRGIVESGPVLCRYVDRRNPGPVDPVVVLASFQATPLAFDYNGRRVGFLGDANNDGTISNQQALFQIHAAGPMVAWSARGDGGCAYVIQASNNGFAIVPFWGQNGDEQFYREVLASGLMVVGSGLALAGVNLATTVGRAIVSAEFAAAYPSITAALGNTALTTAVNGGNVQAAVSGSVVSLAGSIAGNYAGTLTDSALVGTLAQAAASAALVGGDIEDAAKRAAMMFAIDRGADIAQTAIKGDEMEIPGYDFDSLAPASGVEFDPGSLGPVAQPAGGIVNFAPFDLSPPVYGSAPGFDFGFDLPPLDAPALSLPAPAPHSGASGWDFAMQALKMLPQFINRGTPQVQATPPTAVRAGGSVNPAALPPNVATRGPDGKLYVNNGNGSYSVIDAQGRTTTLPMPGASGSIASGASDLLRNPAVLLGGAAVLALVLLRRR